MNIDSQIMNIIDQSMIIDSQIEKIGNPHVKIGSQV